MANVRLGYAIGSGDPVLIPVRHMVVTGITQEAGKTTTLEALIERSGRQALAFITKRGEKTFTAARRIEPYFREQVDWEFVASVLESSRGEKMKFERGWIMKASRGAKTLADVLANVRKLGAAAQAKSRSMDVDLYMQLEEYLKVIVPAIAAVRWAKTIVLGDGLNVMDLTGMSDNLQQLVIRSSMLWLHEHAEETILVIPEAWKFVPQKYRSPVKQAAESYIRQGAGVGNYVWLDSQDIAGVDKPILKMCPVWILGVQRERNEIKTTLDHIPAGTRKPKPEDIAHLELGQFIACYGKHTIPTYVQPTWMTDDLAAMIARGEYPVERARDMAKPTTHTEEADVKQSEARELERENERLSVDLAKTMRENDELTRRVAQLERADKRLSRDLDEPDEEVLAVQVRGADRRPSPAVAAGDGVLSDDLYRQIRSRIIADPVVLKVATQKKQLDVEVEIETVTADGKTWLGRTAQLVAEGFFKTPQKNGIVFKELERRGASGIPARVYEATKQLVDMGFLTNEPTGFQEVPDMKVNIRRDRK